MVSLLLAIIYLAFISLGLPDSLLGAAWPSIYPEFDVPVSFAGIVSMIIAGGTILSSLFSDRLIKRFQTATVTLVSVLLTALALFGFSFSNAFWQLCLWAIPYGLGAGSIDAALNNFVALHYKSKHMSWLHCFWGIGATAGPYIMGYCLTAGAGFSGGYRTVGIIQMVLVGCLLLSLPLWKKMQSTAQDTTESHATFGFQQALSQPGAKAVLCCFFCYCSLEATAGLWASSYFVLHHGLDADTAASWAALFYLGITAGRLVCGFIADRLSGSWMVRIGQVSILIGILLFFVPTIPTVSLIGLLLIGIGCAPIFPTLLHLTPQNFGADKSQLMMGMQMASAYLGTTFMSPLFGVFSDWFGIGIYPIYLLVFIVLMFFMAEKMNRIREKRLLSSDSNTSTTVS